jgi:hypothetical protein
LGHPHSSSIRPTKEPAGKLEDDCGWRWGTPANGAIRERLASVGELAGLISQLNGGSNLYKGGEDQPPLLAPCSCLSRNERAPRPLPVVK